MVWLAAIAVLILAYTYAGYPVLIWVLARYQGRPVRAGNSQIPVAVLIAARNEAATLPRKLANLLELARQEPIREIWIGLDGCTDGTAERVQEQIKISNIQYPISNHQGGGDVRSGNPLPPKIHILEFAASRGKAAVLNELMAKATQPVLIMMDARQRIEAGAIQALLRPLADPQVGVVSGALVYEQAGDGVQKGAESYWGYEKFIRHCESRYWAVPGATGAFYAIRRELCGPIPENTLVDDVLIPMRAVLKGFRCLFEPSARVFDLPSTRFQQEGLRKRRTLAGIWQLWRLEPALFSIRTNPIWFQWISHKVLRLLTPFLVLFLLVSLGFLAWNGVAAAQVFFGAGFGAFCASAAAYWIGRKVKSRILGLLGAFFGVNWSLLQAAGDAASGRFQANWKK